MRNNRLTKEELDFIKYDPLQKDIYKFILKAHANDKNLKFIYILTLQGGQTTCARFNSEEFFDGILYVTFCVLKTSFKNIEDCLKKNKILIFNYQNFPLKYKLVTDENDYTLTLTTNQFCKYDFEGSQIWNVDYNSDTNELCIILTYFNSDQSKKIQISKRQNVDLFIKFEGVKNVTNFNFLKNKSYKIDCLKIKNWGLDFYTYNQDSGLDIINDVPSVSHIRFEKAIIKVIKDQKLYYSYVKNNYYFENDCPIIKNIIKVAIEKKRKKKCSLDFNKNNLL